MDTVHNTDGLERIPTQRFSRASNPWMSELHRPLKQVDDDCLIACHLIFLYPGKEVYFLAMGRVSPSGRLIHSLSKRLIQHKGFFPNG